MKRCVAGVVTVWVVELGVTDTTANLNYCSEKKNLSYEEEGISIRAHIRKL